MQYKREERALIRLWLCLGYRSHVSLAITSAWTGGGEAAAWVGRAHVNVHRQDFLARINLSARCPFMEHEKRHANKYCTLYNFAAPSIFSNQNCYPGIFDLSGTEHEFGGNVIVLEVKKWYQAQSDLRQAHRDPRRLTGWWWPALSPRRRSSSGEGAALPLIPPNNRNRSESVPFECISCFGKNFQEVIFLFVELKTN